MFNNQFRPLLCCKMSHIMNVKTVELEKSLLKVFARVIYFVGLGDIWYEPMVQSNGIKVLYKFWCLISNVLVISIVFSEVLGVLFRDDLTVKELNDGTLFSLAHSLILLKFATLHFKREQIKEFLKKLMANTRCSFSFENEKLSIKKVKRFLIVLAIPVYSCLIFTTMEGIIQSFQKGVPLQTIITYWPHLSDHGVFTAITRVLIQFQWWYFISIMVAMDGICITALTYLGFRFRALRMLFNSFRKNLVANTERKSLEELEEEYKKSLVSAIKLHDEILWCTRSQQGALGNIYNIQVIQNITLVAICLIKLVSVDQSIPFFLALLAFLMCCLVLTGAYMVLCGDITHEASLVPSAIFYSGWELCSARARLRPLLVLSIQRSQAPVIMTAFGIFDLSYQNFIQILRTSYSFFAVMY